MMMCVQMKNPARIMSGAGFLVSVCAFALSGRGPAPPVGKQDGQSKQQARQPGSRFERASGRSLEVHREPAWEEPFRAVISSHE
jgi:hypothetical protein